MTEGPSFEELEQARLEPTLEAAQMYREQHPDEFGGIYWEWEPVMHVELLFTGHVEEHLAALRALVPHPDRIEVRHCRYSDAQIKAWQEQIHEWVRGRWASLSVTVIGSARTEIGYVPQVGIWPWSEEQADRIRRELAHIPVELAARGRAVIAENYGRQRPPGH
jgi:hypothetical protein